MKIRQQSNNRFRLSPLSLAVRTCVVGISISHGVVSNASKITVDTVGAANTGCTLQEAINSANRTDDLVNGCAVGSSSGIDTITFSNSLPSTIISESISVGQKDIVIDASNISGGITIDGNNTRRNLALFGGNVTLNNLNIINGQSALPGPGILASNANLTLNNSTVTGNSSSVSGGGIEARNTSTLYINNSSVSGNSSNVSGGGISVDEFSNLSLSDSSITGNYSSVSGGGIYIRGVRRTVPTKLNIHNSLIGNNSATYRGGGIYIDAFNFNGSNFESNIDTSSIYNNWADVGAGIAVNGGVDIILRKSTLSDNSASTLGGGIAAFNDTQLNTSLSTLSANSAGVAGGAIFASASVESNLNNSTVSGNSAAAGGGVYMRFSSTGNIDNSTLTDNTSVAGGAADARSDSNIDLRNSIVANSIGADCYGGVVPDSASIIEDGSCNAVRSGDPSLLPLADNGGDTETHALDISSPAIGSGNTNVCAATDQRGERRNEDTFTLPIQTLSGNIAIITFDDECDVGAVEVDI